MRNPKLFILIIAFLSFTGIDNVYCSPSFNDTNNEFQIYVQGSLKTVTEVLSIYLQHKSISGDEKMAGDWLKSVCIENGLFIGNFGQTNGNYNFCASLYPLSKGHENIVFLNHIDVVKAGEDSLWSYPPFSGHITDTEIWGRGAYDNKGPAIMQLFSILKLKDKYNGSDLPYNVSMLSVSCEETQCDGGVKYVVENHLSELNPIVIIGEGASELNAIIQSKSPNQMYGISVAHKRPLWLELNLTIPTSGHGSVTPKNYVNKEITIALSRLLKRKPKAIFNDQNIALLKGLGNQEKGIKKFMLEHPRLFKPFIVHQLRKQPELFALFSNTVTITGLNNNNETINKIPNNIKVLLDCRLMPNYSNAKFVTSIRRRMKNNNIKIKLHAKMKRMKASKTNNKFYVKLKEAVQTMYPNSKVIPILLPNFNDAGIFRSLGIQSFSINPVAVEMNVIECIHAENERIPIQAMYSGTETYQLFIENCMDLKSLIAIN